jgi:thiol-disulfide isomerase/thioredoxin
LLPDLGKNPDKAREYISAVTFIARSVAGNNLQDQYKWVEQLLNKAQHEGLQLLNEEPLHIGLIKLDSLAEKKAKKRRKNYRKSRILAARGLIYTKQKKYKLAEQTLKKAARLSNDPVERREIREQLAALYTKTHQSQKALDIYWALQIKRPSKDLRKKLQKSYIAYHGSMKGFKKLWRRKIREKFKKERINKAAPSLATATDLNGAPLDTTALAGKVVIANFGIGWETSCKTCKSELEFVQKLYDQFKNNSEVKFVIIYSNGYVSRKQLKNWTAKQDYTLPFYYDKDSKLAKAFNVYEYPETFVIGENGRIQFKVIGYGGSSYGGLSMEQRLAMRINLALKHKNTADDR